MLMANQLQSQIRKDIRNLRTLIQELNTHMNIPKSGQAITPSDSTVHTKMLGIYVGVSGDVVVTLNGTDLTLSNVPVGYHPGEFTKIKATGTTATDIVGYWS